RRAAGNGDAAAGGQPARPRACRPGSPGYSPAADGQADGEPAGQLTGAGGTGSAAGQVMPQEPAHQAKVAEPLDVVHAEVPEPAGRPGRPVEGRPGQRGCE